MPSQPASEPVRHLLVAGTAHYECLADADLDEVPLEIACVSAAFGKLGYADTTPVIDPDRCELVRRVDAFGRGCGAGDIVVLYYTGHGVKDEERFYLLTRDSDPEDLDMTAAPVEDLARLLAKRSSAAQVLMILDACYAGSGAAEFLRLTTRLVRTLGGEGPGLFVIAAARARQEAVQGALSSALAVALAADEAGRLGGRVQQFLAIDDVMDAVDRYLRERYPTQAATWSASAVRGGCRLFPNPRYRATLRAGLDLDTQRAFAEHWVPKAQGVELGAEGWYFTGRTQALRELAAWLGGTSSDGRPRVVTGGPGTGKSALLARIVTMSHERYRRAATATRGSAVDPGTLPPEHVVDAAVHARRKCLADIVVQLADAFGLAVRDADELVQALGARAAKRVIVVDALDEADEKDEIVDELLVPLATVPHVFLLLGTRPDTVRVSTDTQRVGAFGEDTIEIDLDDACYLGLDDVARYVERRLLASEEPERDTPYRDRPEIARTVAQAVSARAAGSFLVAHTAVLGLLASPFTPDVAESDWVERLPSGLDEALERFLEQIDRRRPEGLTPRIMRAVLRPLAFAEGEGLPWTMLWAPLASAISGLSISDAQISAVCRHGGAFVIEALENERSVYRLYHERIAEPLRRGVDDGDTQCRIVDTLLATVGMRGACAPEPDWARAHPYLLSHLATHALKARRIGELSGDAAFLAAADPVRVQEALSKAPEPFARRAAAAHALAFHHLHSQPYENRIAYLELAARRLGDDALAEQWVVGCAHRHWSVPWMKPAAVSSHRVVRMGDEVTTLAAGTLGRRAVFVTGMFDGTVRLWDAASGAPLTNPLAGHRRWVRSVAFGGQVGSEMIVSGGVDGTVRRWTAITGRTIGEPLLGHEKEVSCVAFGTLAGKAIIVSGGVDGTVRLWDAASGVSRGAPVVAQALAIESVAFAIIEGRATIAFGSRDGTVRVLDLSSNPPTVRAIRGHQGWVGAVAFGTIKGRSVIASGGFDGTVRRWDAVYGTALGEPLRGHEGWIRAVAFGTLDGRSVLASGAEDGAVQLWDADAASGTPSVEPLLGHENEVSAVAFCDLGDSTVIVSAGFDDTVRLWDIASNASRAVPSGGWEIGVRAVAVGLAEAQAVLVSGGFDGTVFVLEATSGAPCHAPIAGHDGEVSSVALGSHDGRAIVVSGGHDGAVRLWDATTGTPLDMLRYRHDAEVTSVAIEVIDGQTFVASGGRDGVVWLRGLSSDAPSSIAWRGDDRWVNAVALGVLAGRPIVVSGGFDGTVRLWDTTAQKPEGRTLHRHDGAVYSVALATLAGRSVIASGGADGAVLLAELATGSPIVSPLRRHDTWVVDVAFGTIGGRTVLVSGAENGSVQLSDLRRAEPMFISLDARIHALDCWQGGIVVASSAGLTGVTIGTVESDRGLTS